MKSVLYAAGIAAGIAAGLGFPLTATAQDDPDGRVSRTYDLRPITLNRVIDRIAPRGELVFVGWWRADGRELRGATFGDEIAPILAARDEDPSNRPAVGPDYEDLSELLIEAAWSRDEGLSAHTASGRLLLTATAETHALVSALLDEARHRRRSVRIECVVARRALLDEISASWEDAAPEIDPAVFASLLLDESTIVLEASARTGELAIAGDEDNRTFVADAEVNQTGVIPVLNPVVEQIRTGERLLVRPVVLPQNRGVYVELAIDLSSADATSFQVGDDWGKLRLPLIDESIFSLVTVLPSNEPRIVAWLGGEDDLVLLARAVASPAGSASPADAAPRVAETADGPIWRLYSQDLLVTADEFRTWWTPERLGEQPWDRGELQQFIHDGLAGRVFEELGSFETKAGFVLLGGPIDLHRRLATLLDDRRARRTRLATIRLERLTLSRPAFVGLQRFARDGGVLEDGYREYVRQAGVVIERSSFGLVATESAVHALRQARIRSMVVDTESVSGGTGFAIVERLDPVVDECGDGTELRVRVGLSENGTAAHLQIHGVSAELSALDVHEIALPSLEREGRTQTSEGRALGTLSRVQLRVPQQNVRYWNVDREVELGRGVILERTARPGEGGDVLIATVKRSR